MSYPKIFIAGVALALAVLALFFLLPGEPSSPKPPAVADARSEATPVETPALSAPSDFPNRLQQILKEDEASRDAHLGALISSWIGRDPAAFRSYLSSLGLDENSSLAEEFFAALPGALPNVDEKTASSPYLSELIIELIEQNAEADPRAADGWAEKWLLGDSLDHARSIIVGELAKDSPTEALQLLSKIKQPLRRVEALGAVGAGYAKNDPAGATKWAQSFPSDTEAAVAMNSVLGVLAEQDAEGASHVFDAFQARVSSNYASAVAAARRAKGLPEKPTLNEQIDDAGGDTFYSAESPDLGLLSEAAQTIVTARAQEDPQSALQWAQKLEGVLKAQGLRAAYGAWAESAPEAAFDSYRKSGWIDRDAVQSIFSGWADVAPEPAGAEAVRISGTVERGDALVSVVETWAQAGDDSSPMIQWIDGLSRPEDRDLANRAVATTLDADEPRLAWSRAVLISNADLRKSALNSAFSSLVLADSKAAQAALNQAPGLTQAERTSLTKLLSGAATKR